jgi:hypothetical protein
MIPRKGRRFSEKIMRKQEPMEPATALDHTDAARLLPDIFARWFAQRGWAAACASA